MTIIGIAGGTGSGKTTVVKKIVEALPPNSVAVVPLDSYYNDTSDLTPEERKLINFDHPEAFDWKLLHKQIGMLKRGEAIEQPTYSYVISNRLPETVHVEPKPVIIIEGIMTLVDRKLRNMIILRDVVERGRTVDMVLNRYLEVLKPMHEQFIEPTKKYADIIIPQGGENMKGIGIICKYIEGLTDKATK